MRYRGSYIEGFLLGEPTTSARIVLDIIIPRMIGAPAFVCRQIPVYSLQHDLTLEQTNEIIYFGSSNGEFIILLICDNLKKNQA